MSRVSFEIFQYPRDDSLLLVGVYDMHLVAVSVLLAIFASIMVLHLVGQLQRSDHRPTRILMQLAGSLAFGGGVWAMHFVGMLAFELCSSVDYDPWLTLYSLLPALLAALIGIHLLSRPRVSHWQILGGGSLMGVGIGAMHYTGMAAMEMAPLLRYDAGLFVLSLLVAVVLACLAVWLRFWLQRREFLGDVGSLVLGGSVMGLAITAMHYTGMAAARFVGFPELEGDNITLDVNFLALIIAAIVVIFTLGVLLAGGYLSYRTMVQRLVDSEQKFRSLVGNIPGIAYRCLPDKDWTMLYISDAVESYTGYPASTFLTPGQKSFNDIIHPDDRERVGQNMLMTQKTFEVEYRIIDRDGQIRQVWENGCLVRNDQGEVQWLDGVILDITQRHDMEQALRWEKARAEEAAAAKTAFLANVSHEIRTPMNAITGFTEVLLSSTINAEQRHHLETIRIATDSLLHLLNDILDAAKLEKGLVELVAIDFSLSETLRQVVATLRADAEKKGLSLTLDYDPALGEFFRGDEQRLRQVLLNILGNAVKFTQEGGVAVSAIRESGQVCLRIIDTGIGIAPDRLENIFEPFTQGDASMARRFGGTGLGTTISKQLVELMGGTIEVASEPGQGSEFTLRIPLPPGDAVQAPANRQEVDLPPLRILVVDDVLPNLQLLELLLCKSGHHVVSAPDGQQALDIFRRQRFDIVLMDVQMPVMDGLEASRQIRAHEREQQLPATPIIALTASVLEEDRQAAFSAGMDGFTTKPVNLVLLQHEMARLLGIQLRSRSGDSAPDGEGAASVLAAQVGLSTWLDEQTYAQALLRFARDQAGLLTQLDAIVAAGDQEEFYQCLHRVKGAALNLALLALSDHVGEYLARPLPVDTDWQRQRPQFDTVLTASWRAIDNWCAPFAPRGTGDDQSIDRRELQVALTTLRQSLQRHEFDEAALAIVRAGFGSRTLVHRLEQALEDFEFEQALVLLERLASQLASQEDMDS